MPRREDIDSVFDRQKERIEKCVKSAIESSYEVGTGFVVVKRLNRGSEFIVTQMLWPEVEVELRKLGTKGAVGGYERF